jgi:integrase
MKLYRRGKKGLFTVELWRLGKRYVRATGTANKSQAEAFGRNLVANLETGRYLPRQKRVTWDEIADDLETYYRIQGRRSGNILRHALAHLRDEFGGQRAHLISANRIARYKAARLETGAAKATINRELNALSKAFSVAIENGKLSQRPAIKRLDDSDNVRQGFVSMADYLAIRECAADWLAGLTDFLYWSGVRLNEGLTLEWRNVDRVAKVIRVRAERVKNKQPHEIPIVGHVERILTEAFARRRLDCPFVFHVNGRPLKKDRAEKWWKRAASAAGFAGVLIHDLRRSFVRNTRQLGMAEVLIMKFTGHRTAEVFRRYNIIDDAEKRAAMLKLEEWSLRQPTRSGIVAGRFPKQAVNSGLETEKDEEISTEGGYGVIESLKPKSSMRPRAPRAPAEAQLSSSGSRLSHSSARSPACSMSL